MALHWNLEKCENLEEIKSEKEWGTTNNLIWMTMAVGLGEISEQNWKEFLFRIRVLERIDGAFLYINHPTTDPPESGKIRREALYYTVEMVKKRIGLYTNVSNETRATWIKRRTTEMFEKMEKEIEEEAKKLKPNLKIVK